MRYQFYREHKYLCAVLNNLERLIAKTDFRQADEINAVEQAFQSVTELLKAHAQYENERLHILLKNRDSKLHEHAEEDHAHQEEQLERIQEMIHSIYNCPTDDDKISRGYQLYLAYRKFVADNLLHLHEEETLILPELQRLYSDEELRQVEAPTYHELAPEEIVQMMQELFPHLNASDRLAILLDIQTIQPEKFIAAWNGIAPSFDQEELKHLSQQLKIAPIV